MSKYPLGRPSKYDDKYCDMLIDWMRQGKSFVTFATQVPCNPDTLAEWAKVHPRFSEAKRWGKVFEMAWWDDLHRRCAATGEGNSTMIVWAQKNKFPKYYKERLAKQKSDVNITQSLAMTGDFKSLIATMTPEQMYQLSLAMEQKAKELEATHETKDTK